MLAEGGRSAEGHKAFPAISFFEINPQKVLFVCSKDYDRNGYRKALDEINIKSVSFTSFEPCPEVSSVENGIEAYKSNECDFVVAVGGGSAIDTAKGIKFYSKLDLIANGLFY